MSELRAALADPLIRQKVAALHAALADPVLGPEAMERIRSLIERVVLVPEAGALRIDLEGQVGAILGLCADAQKPRTGCPGFG